MRNSNLTIDRIGIIEKEEDAVENILNQDADEKRMEQLEEKMRKMADMHKQGSDIYFGGFSHMKRFPFFNDMINWFTPFYLEHPSLCSVSSKLGDTMFLNALMERSNFCESDKYSFAFAIEQIADQLPNNIKNVINSDAAFGSLVQSDDKEDAFSIRRTYLQDLYRFFRLYDKAGDFINPFEDNGKGDFISDSFFFTYKCFEESGLDDVKLRLAMHLYKHQKTMELAELLTTFQSSDPRFSILIGYTNINLGKADAAYKYFDDALIADPDNRWALKGKARAALINEDYDLAEEVYGLLLNLEPGHKGYTMKRCVALLKMGKFSEVREELFRLDYQYPDDMNVKRLLAWAILSDDNLEKASQLYDTLLSECPVHEDYINAGYCQWAMGNIERAVEYFRDWMARSGGDTEQLLKEFRRDTDTLSKYNISETDEYLMLSLVA